MRPIIRMLAVAVLIAGGVLFFRAITWQRTHTPRPLSMPVSLAAGKVTSPFIDANLDREYEIALALESKPTNPGVQDSTVTQDILFSEKLDISWQLKSGEQVVCQGHSEGGGWSAWGSTVRTVLGKFHGRKDGVFTLDVRVNRDASNLDKANPTLIVQIPQLQWEDYAAGIFFRKASAWLAAFLGVILLVLSFIVGRNPDGRVGPEHHPS